MKRKLLLFITVLSTCFSTFAENVDHVMHVTLTSGKVDTYIVGSHPNVYFDKDYTIIASYELTTSYETSQIESYTFADINATSIEEVINENKVEGICVKFVDGVMVQVRGVAPETLIRTYSLTGELQHPIISTLSDGVDISLSMLPAGTYVVKIGNEKSIKIQKR